MEGLRYLKVLIFTTMALVISYILFNYTVDSMNVFHQKVEPFESYSDVNERFMKSLVLEDYCSEFNTIIFGSSRVSGYLTDDIENEFVSGKAYNYGVQAETLLGIYQKLKWLVSINCLPKRIIIPVSIDRIELYDFRDDNRLLMLENPQLFKEQVPTFEYMLLRWEVFKKYLFSSSVFTKNIRKIKNAITSKTFHLKFFPGTGNTYYHFDHPCEDNDSPVGEIPLSEGGVDLFVKMAEAISKYVYSFGSEVVFVWNPQLYTVQMSYELDGVVSFIEKLSGIFPYVYRIPLKDSRLKNINYYHDCSHFKKELGASIFDEKNKIFTLDLIKEFENEHQWKEQGLDK